MPLEPANPAAASDLISFLKALPDCRMRLGIRFPQWWILLVIVAVGVSNLAPDVEHLEPMVQRIAATAGALPDVLTTDAGY